MKILIRVKITLKGRFKKKKIFRTLTLIVLLIFECLFLERLLELPKVQFSALLKQDQILALIGFICYVNLIVLSDKVLKYPLPQFLRKPNVTKNDL